MKKFLLLLIASIMGVTSMWAAATQPTSGSGTADSPYLIANAGNLEWFRDQVNAGKSTICGKLTANINLSTVCSATLGTWTPIGKDATKYIFKGVFDGGGYTISNLYINQTNDYYYQALFGYLSGAEIKNVTVSGTVNATYYTAGIIGRITGGKIENCVNKCTITGTYTVGGVVSSCYDGTIVTKCRNSGIVTGTQDYTGGIAGQLNGNGSIISLCKNEGKVINTSGKVVGGIAGFLQQGTLKQCINTADLDGSGATGGICGSPFSGSISFCLSVGNISAQYGTATAKAGAIVGNKGSSASVSNCHYLNTISIKENGSAVSVLGVRANNSTNYTSDAGSGTVGHDANVMASGEVAYALGNDVFGQFLGVTNDAYPSFLEDSKGLSKVLKLTFNNSDNTLNCARYLMTGTQFSTYNQYGGYPNFPTGTYKWVIGTDRNGTEFTRTYKVTTDLTLTAIGLAKDTDDYYTISNYQELGLFRDKVNGGETAANAKLTDNITMTNLSWTPIGYSSKKYSGIFDGAGYTITNLNIEGYQEYQALFGYASGASCTIKNLTVNGTVTNTANYTAGIVAYFEASSGKIENCVNNCTVTGTGFVGGVIGNVTPLSTIPLVTKCINNGSVTGSRQAVGGVVGRSPGKMSLCKNTGKIINQSGYNTGGVVGEIYGGYTGAYIKQCINTGDIEGSGPTGGICGYLYNGAMIGAQSLTTCISTASNISAKDYSFTQDEEEYTYPANAGAIIGVNNKKTISSCHYLNTVVIKENGTVVPTMGVRANGDPENNNKNTGDATSTKAQDATTFASGELTYTLGNTVFGQNIGTEPVPTFLAADGSNKVFKVTFNDTDNTLNSTRYATTGKAVTDFPSLPTSAYKWVVGTNRNGTEFTASSVVTADLTITAVGLAQDADGCYLIGSAGDLVKFRDMVNGGKNTIDGKLTGNIDLSNVCSATLGSWEPIGWDNTSFLYAYCGTFDGAGFTISNLYINEKNGTNSKNRGLFGYALAVIKNLTVNGSITSMNHYTGGIVGIMPYSNANNENGKIENCVNNCTISGVGYAGGIVGAFSSNTEVINCTNNGAIKGTNFYVGGIAGNSAGNMSGCKNTGKVVSTGHSGAGGLAGRVFDRSVTNCINTADVEGKGAVGGVCGFLQIGAVNNSISTAKNIIATDYKSSLSTIAANAGAIVGVNYNRTISNCHYLNTVTIKENGTAVAVMGVRANGFESDAVKNTGETEGETAGHDATSMASGEVAYLLGNTAFGQNIGTDAVPAFLAADDSNKVLKATIYRGIETGEAHYMNNDLAGIEIKDNDIAVIEDAIVSGETLGGNIVYKSGNAYVANDINLVDAKPFYAPCEFTAKTAVFTPILTPATESGETQSYISNALTIVPFDGCVMCGGSAEGLVYNEDFWVKSFNGLDDTGNVSLMDVDNGNVPANTPIFLAGATHQEYGNISFDKSAMTIYGENVTVSSAIPAQQVSQLAMQGTYTGLEAANVYQLDATGCALELKETATIKPFGAYFSTTDASPAATLSFSESSIPTGIDAVGSDKTEMEVWAAGRLLMIDAPQAGSVAIYTLDGTRVKQVDVEAGRTVINNLLPGYYIVNRTKVAIK